MKLSKQNGINKVFPLFLFFLDYAIKLNNMACKFLIVSMFPRKQGL